MLGKSLSSWLQRLSDRGKRSTRIKDESLIAQFTAGERNTFLVSFPRTGSHWLRMLTELYFGRPTLVRTFYFPERTDFLLLHTHDLDLTVQRSHVIYLYRDPVDTIYSQLAYEGETWTDSDRVRRWATLYAKHLDKWLVKESFTELKTVVSYGVMRNDLIGAFAHVAAHFDQALDEERLLKAAAQVTKDEAKRKTKHDERVIQLSQQYERDRARFRQLQGQFVWQIVLQGCSDLEAFFN